MARKRSASVTLNAGRAINVSQENGFDQAPHDIAPDHAFHPSWRDILGRVQVVGQARFDIEPSVDISL